MNKDPRYFVLYCIFAWNVGMLFYNVYNPMPFLLLTIMCSFPTVLFFGIFFALDNNSEKNITKNMEGNA
jgi:hypothetical protein